jgi:thiamine-monophosphate kinase
MTGEEDRIDRIAAILGAARSKNVTLSIGDDAAVLEPIAEKVVVTIDEQVEGTHFTRALCSLEDVGWRATMAAASDLAAMGAAPIAAVAAWVLPATATDEDVERIARGQREACDVLGSVIVGGNLARGPALSIATTWIGACARPVARAGAEPGDGLYACGDLGLASAGLHALKAGLSAPAAALAFRRPRARIADGLRMAAVARACVDVSDGVARDAGHIAAASGVRVVLDESALRGYLHSATIEVARACGKDPLDLALGGGEDYALLCASAEPIEGFVRIGAVEPGEGVVVRGEGGDRPARGGYDHFA